MRNSHVYGTFTVENSSTFKSTVSALNGVTLGYNNTGVFAITKAKLAQLTGDLNIITGGVQFDGNYIIHVKNDNVISFSAANKILNLGDDGTQKSPYNQDYMMMMANMNSSLNSDPLISQNHLKLVMD